MTRLTGFNATTLYPIRCPARTRTRRSTGQPASEPQRQSSSSSLARPAKVMATAHQKRAGLLRGCEWLNRRAHKNADILAARSSRFPANSPRIVRLRGG
jgi:hypothetical protein